MAQVVLRAWSLADVAVAVIVIAALAAIVFIALRAMHIEVPQWAMQVAGVLVVAFVCILAIKFLLVM